MSDLTDIDGEKATKKRSAQMTAAERRYLLRGLDQPGGKLPLFDRLGQQISKRTIEACVKNGWCEPWARNPIKPDWLVCKLTDKGRAALVKAGD